MQIDRIAGHFLKKELSGKIIKGGNRLRILRRTGKMPAGSLIKRTPRKKKHEKQGTKSRGNQFFGCQIIILTFLVRFPVGYKIYYSELVQDM